jgi:hypothetical protein
VSYDLYLRPRSGPYDSAAIDAYFAMRPCYQLSQYQAVYGNGDTGVYFLFDLHQEMQDEAETHYPIAFNINYFRPSLFIIEAERELTRFVKTFDLVIEDPQIGGMGVGDYDAAKLVEGWRQGNDFAIRALRKQDPPIPHWPVATDKLTRAWRWNLRRAARQAELGDDAFVPRIMFAEVDGEIVTLAAWVDAIPCELPDVDYFWIVRQTLAPKRFFRRRDDHGLAPRAQFLPLLQRYGAPAAEGGTLLGYRETPETLAAFVRGLPARRPTPKTIPADKLIDRESVEAAEARS